MNNSSIILSDKSVKTQPNSEKNYVFQDKTYSVSELNRMTYSELVSLALSVNEFHAEINREKTRIIEENKDLTQTSITNKLKVLNNRKSKYAEFKLQLDKLIAAKKVKLIDDFFYFLWIQFKKNVEPKLFWKCVADANKIVPLPKDIKQRLNIRDSNLVIGE